MISPEIALNFSKKHYNTIFTHPIRYVDHFRSIEDWSSKKKVKKDNEHIVKVRKSNQNLSTKYVKSGIWDCPARSDTALKEYFRLLEGSTAPMCNILNYYWIWKCLTFTIVKESFFLALLLPMPCLCLAYAWSDKSL